MATVREDVAAATWNLRPMAQADLAQVAALERESYVFPWNDQIFADCLRVGYHCVVVDTGAGVSGYGVLSMGAGEAHAVDHRAVRGRRDPAVALRGERRSLRPEARELLARRSKFTAPAPGPRPARRRA